MKGMINFTSQALPEKLLQSTDRAMGESKNSFSDQILMISDSFSEHEQK